MSNYEHRNLKGPIMNNENYLYELELDINNDYVQINDIFKNLYEYELKERRVYLMSEIVTFGHPALTTKSADIDITSDYIVNLSKK